MGNLAGLWQLIRVAHSALAAPGTINHPPCHEQGGHGNTSCTYCGITSCLPGIGHHREVG